MSPVRTTPLSSTRSTSSSSVIRSCSSSDALESASAIVLHEVERRPGSRELEPDGVVAAVALGERADLGAERLFAAAGDEVRAVEDQVARGFGGRRTLRRVDARGLGQRGEGGVRLTGAARAEIDGCACNRLVAALLEQVPAASRGRRQLVRRLVAVSEPRDERIARDECLDAQLDPSGEPLE